MRREVFLLSNEAVNDIVRDSACSQPELEFRADAHGLMVRVSDNGRGFSTGGEGTGHRLRSMCERSEALGGHLEWSRTLGEARC
jgi:glucose-6-phosphate-specific signal transduction histidine kinase